MFGLEPSKPSQVYLYFPYAPMVNTVFLTFSWMLERALRKQCGCHVHFVWLNCTFSVPNTTFRCSQLTACIISSRPAKQFPGRTSRKKLWHWIYVWHLMGTRSSSISIVVKRKYARSTSGPLVKRKYARSTSGPLVKRKYARSTSGPLVKRKYARSSSGPLVKRKYARSTSGPLVKRKYARSSSGPLVKTSMQGAPVALW